MDSQSSPKPFPLTRFIHYGTFKHYYAFGNTPAEDFLRSVAADPATPTRPTILSLGCGDIRSCMYTLWKNFGFEGKSVSGFAGVDFVLNDCRAAVLARNVLFLYLCLCMPEDGASRAKKEWVASVWSIWYNHELTPENDEVLTRALAQLLQWSETAQEWAQCRLGVMVRFSSLDTFREVKQMWALWHRRGVKVESVRAMKLARQHHFKKRARALCICEDIHEMMQSMATGVLSPMCYHCGYPPEAVDTMVKEWSAYAVDGSTFAETALGLPHSTVKTSVNMTLFEHVDGTYTVHSELVPYWAFLHASIYSPIEVSKMTKKGDTVLPLLPVADEYFKVAPLLANSVQQFTMWLTATANMMKQSENNKVLFTFDCSDAVSFCQTLLKFPEQYSHSFFLAGPLQFDAIHTSNLLDYFFGAPALVLVTVPLLKPNGVLFTTSFQYKTDNSTSNEYIENMFGFPPELLPVILGIRCIGNDGQYSSTVSPQPIPPYAESPTSLQPVSLSLVWKNTTAHPLIISSLTESAELTSYLIKSCFSAVYQLSTLDLFLAIVSRFTANLHMKTSPSYLFWEPVCKKIIAEPILKPLLIQLQTQSLLHGLHMHITVTEADCPLCTGQPLNDYIGGYTIHFTASCIGFYEEQLFSVHLESIGSPSDFAVVTSIAGSSNGADVQLDFLFPKRCFEMFQYFTVFKTAGPLYAIANNAVARGILQDIRSCSPTKYFFMKTDKASTTIPVQSSMGEIIKHNGNATIFETTVSISDLCIAVLEETTLTAERTEIYQLQVRCGERLQMTIIYPYPIQSNVHIKLSKKNKTVLIKAERASSCPYNDDPTLFIDPNNPLALPQIQYGDQRIKSHFSLQTPLPNIDPAGSLYMKSVLIQLAEKASKDNVAIALCDRYNPGDPDTYGMIIVHGIHFDPYFRSPVMHISFCFPSFLPKPSLPKIASFWKQLTHRECCFLSINDEEYKILNEALTHFAAMTRELYGNPGIPSSLAKHKGWQYFQQAMMFPLYPNTQLLQVYDTVKLLLPVLIATNSSSNVHKSQTVPSEIKKQSMESRNKCTYCEKACENLKKCGHCKKVQYCGKECQTKHWKEHKTVCRSSSNERAGVLFSCAKCKKTTNLSRCSCQHVAYCSKECQKEDWPNHGVRCTRRRKEKSHHNEKSPQSQNKQSFVNPNLQDNVSVHKCGKCSNCNKAVDQQLKWCPCHKAAYCSIECQRLNWPLHKHLCTSIKKC